MTIGFKANSDGSGALQVNGTDRVTLSTAGVMDVPGGITANVTGDVTGNVTGNVTGAADKLSTASGSAPSYAARAWVNFNGTGTVAIRASGNVSSITDNGVGDYTINFTTAMSDANYGVSYGSGNLGGTSITRIAELTSQAAGSFRVSQWNGASASSAVDSASMNFSIFR